MEQTVVDTGSQGLLLKALIAIVTAGLPVIGWIGKSHVNLLGRVGVLENTTSKIADISKTQIADGNRLVAVESAVLQLTEMQHRTDENYKDLSTKLEILPRIDESLKYLARVCSTIVPREEWEKQNKYIEERIKDRDSRDDE